GSTPDGCTIVNQGVGLQYFSELIQHCTLSVPFCSLQSVHQFPLGYSRRKKTITAPLVPRLCDRPSDSIRLAPRFALIKHATIGPEWHGNWGETGVVDQNDQDVRCSSSRFSERNGARLGILVGVSDLGVLKQSFGPGQNFLCGDSIE